MEDTYEVNCKDESDGADKPDPCSSIQGGYASHSAPAALIHLDSHRRRVLRTGYRAYQSYRVGGLA